MFSHLLLFHTDSVHNFPLPFHYHSFKLHRPISDFLMAFIHINWKANKLNRARLDCSRQATFVAVAVVHRRGATPFFAPMVTMWGRLLHLPVVDGSHYLCCCNKRLTAAVEVFFAAGVAAGLS